MESACSDVPDFVRRMTLDYSTTPGTQSRRRLYRIVGVLAAVLCAGHRACGCGVTGPVITSISATFTSPSAAGTAAWSMALAVPARLPVVGKPFVTYPLDQVGDYPLGRCELRSALASDADLRRGGRMVAQASARQRTERLVTVTVPNFSLRTTILLSLVGFGLVPRGRHRGARSRETGSGCGGGRS